MVQARGRLLAVSESEAAAVAPAEQHTADS